MLIESETTTHYNPRMLGGGSVVPYIGSWAGEEFAQAHVVRRRDNAVGIGLADETMMDRDGWGVLWTRATSRIGVGRPLFKKLHPLRQRLAMLQLLCQVCAQPADRTDDGNLWLLPEQPSYEADWPEGVPITLPPVCVACARLSVRMCPALRPPYIAVRAHSQIWGVSGVRFRPGPLFPKPVPELEDDGMVHYDDPDVRWVLATQQARSLHNCRFVELDRLV